MSYVTNITKAWKVVPFGKVVRRSQYGLSEPATADGVPYLKMSNIRDGKVVVEGADTLQVDEKTLEDYALKDGDLVFNRTNSLDLVGKTGIFYGSEPVVFASYLVRFQLDTKKADSRFIALWFATSGAAHRLRCLATPGVSQSNINPTTLKLAMQVPLPPLPEQRKIADILSTWDEALTQLDALIEAQERRKKALMQQLLTGRRRLKGFDQSKGKTASDRFGIYPADWKRVRLGEITNEVPTKNADGTDLPVLSCTKHRGLVLSQEYFGKRVYAEDTSGYRLVQRGEFAYATNHIEEGSIGYQNICDAGLVSPIYTVFKTTEAVDDSYLFRVLKSPLLIHFYQINTSASVDRRGSLRYDEFARIYIWLPSKAEQKAIAQVFDTADQQLTLLRTQRTALDQQKRGLMQRLLTGKLRVKTTQTTP